MVPSAPSLKLEQKPPSLQLRCLPRLSFTRPSFLFTPLAEATRCDPRRRVPLYPAGGFAGKAGRGQAVLLQAALRRPCKLFCRHLHTPWMPGSLGCPPSSAALAVMPIIRKPPRVSREAGLGEGHKASRSCVFANNPAEL